MTAPAETETGELISDRQMAKLNLLLAEHHLSKRDEALAWISGVMGRDITSRKDLLMSEASTLIDMLVDGEVRSVENTREGTTVHEAMRRVAYDIGRVGVGKHGRNRDQNYAFRGIDDIINALSPILARHGVIIVPRVIDQNYGERPTQRGGAQMIATLTVEYQIYGPKGDSVTARTVGLGMDTSDKATNKALSAAFKYLLGQVFAIPQVGFNDGDTESPQIEGRVYGRGDTPPQDNDRAPARGDHEGNRTPPPDPGPSHVELLNRVGTLATAAGMSVEQFTAKFREQHGSISVEAMAGMPRDLLNGFVRRVEQYQQQTQASGEQQG
jgi:hypothetical protein